MIEWFLSPSNDSERAISYAMKLYGANQAVDRALDTFLTSDDKKLDLSLKQLQVQKLAREQGLDWKRYMDDDAAEDDRTAQGAIAYGAQQAGKMKPLVSASTATVKSAATVPSPLSELLSAAKGGAKDAFFGPARILSDLMRDEKTVKLAQNAGKIFRYASFL